ncbi:hypothetical protein GIB67_030471 [Kingdonia uniflora]|uniref:RING-type domain-containing protein n=1 Tax=Kingdonia uniflora TaxID=39325 RepID=A0A7J7P7F2_9MAGN|nr:hypothetical protein GIB67_030471 [Kingdonia uniflora]
MDIPPALETHCEGQTDRYPLLMDRSENQNDPEHIIDIARDSDATSSSSSDGDSLHDHEHSQPEYIPSISTIPPISQPSMSSSNGASNSRNSSFIRRGEGYGRRRRSPLNSGLWISIESAVTISQIIASVVVLSISRDEDPQAPLFTWIVGYAAGCFATLPLLYWRFRHRNNQSTGQESTPQRQSASHSSITSEPPPYTSISNARTLEEGNHHPAAATTQNARNVRVLSARLNVLVDHLKMSLDCFFAVWFVVGNVWIFGGHSSSSEAPNMYSCIGYAMPFILCATICCCLPCIISILGFREDLAHTRGATPESISALPTYKFKLKKNDDGDGREINLEGAAGEGGGVVGAGTEKERTIAGEDAACCICLAKYADNDELRELPCAHFFHMECVDKWLKINALCPLCKCEVGDSTDPLPLATSSS